MSELASLAPPSDPLLYQRRAAQWLDRVIEETDDGRAMPTLSDRTPLQPFEALRTLIVQVGGQALADLELVERLAERFAGAPVTLDGPHARRLSAVARRVGLGFIEVPLLKSMVDVARERGYRARRELRRLVRGGGAGRLAGIDQHWSMLAVPRMPDHLADMIPVVRALRDAGHQTLFASETLGEQLRSQGFTVVPHELAPRREQVSLALGIARRASELGRRGITSASAEDKVLAEVVRDVIVDQAFVLGGTALGLNRLLAQVHPRVVLVGNPYTMEGRVACLLAGRHRIPSVCIEHGTIFANDPIWERCPVTKMLVRGEPSRLTLMGYGLGPDRVEVIGAPRLDAFAGRPLATRPVTVLVASSGGGDQVSMAEHQQFIEAVYEAAEQTPELPWVVKLHPKDSPGLYEPVARKHPGARVEVRRADRARTGLEIYEYLDQCRVLVTVISTTALDAMAVGVPVVCLLADEQTTRDRAARVDFLARRTVTRVRTSAELAEAVKKKIEQGPDNDVDARAQAYATELFRHRGASAQRAAEVILRVMKHEAARG